MQVCGAATLVNKYVHKGNKNWRREIERISFLKILNCSAGRLFSGIFILIVPDIAQQSNFIFQIQTFMLLTMYLVSD